MAKEKIQLEFTLNTSPKLLYTRLSTPSGLSEWFADNVQINGKNFNFFWDDSEQVAKLLMKKVNEYVRFKWLDDEDEEAFFEFRIAKDELTGDVALIITDFAESDEVDDTRGLWDSQISELRRAIGL